MHKTTLVSANRPTRNTDFAVYVKDTEVALSRLFFWPHAKIISRTNVVVHLVMSPELSSALYRTYPSRVRVRMALPQLIVAEFNIMVSPGKIAVYMDR